MGWMVNDVVNAGNTLTLPRSDRSRPLDCFSSSDYKGQTYLL